MKIKRGCVTLSKLNTAKIKSDTSLFVELVTEYKELILLKEQNSIDVLESILEMKKKEILENFPNEIWQANDGRWKTHLPNEDRKLIAKATREKLEQAIIDYYTEEEKRKKLKKVTLKKLYPEWLEYKMLKSSSTTYAPRLDCDWKKYYLSDNIINMPIYYMDDIMLEKWAYSLIKGSTLKLTKKQYYNATTIIRGILDYAVRQRIIQDNPFRRFTIEKGHFRKPQKKKPETQVYLEDEEIQVIQRAETEYFETGYTACLAVCLNFYLGLRIGELMALKETDREGDYVYVQRQEVRNQILLPDGRWSTVGYLIDDYLKCDKEVRELYLTNEARRYWDMIVSHNKENGWDKGFLFIHGGNHIHYPTVNKRLIRYCKELDIIEKSNHKIRKTVLSVMVDEVGLDEAQAWGGHSNKTTLLKNYHYSRKTFEQKEEAIEIALKKKCNRTVTVISDNKKLGSQLKH